MDMHFIFEKSLLDNGVFTSLIASSNASAYVSGGSIIGDSNAASIARCTISWTSGWSAVTVESDGFNDVSVMFKKM